MDADPKESSEENAESTANNGELASQQSEGANEFASANPSSGSNSTGSVVKEDNPFSFRHFLSRSQNVHPHSNSQPEMQNRMLDEEFEANRVGGARPKTTKTRANTTRHSRIDSLDLKSPCLPDFVQDHVRVEHDLTSVNHSDNGFQNRVAPENGLFSSHEAENPLDLPRSHSPIHAAGAMPIPLDIANLASSHMVEDDVDVDIGPLDLANLNSSSIHGDLPPQMEEPILPGSAQAHEINNNENVNSLSQLPDFLSDGPMQQQSAAGRMNPNQQQESAMMDLPISSVQQPPSPHYHGSMSMLMEENARLRQQLEVANANERVAFTRIERLESLLEERRRRESEETTTLEQSMEQIENNLKSATQRAVNAESQIAQLKKENRRLQEEVQSLQEAIRLQYSETSPGPVRGLNRTAQELHQAANSAERSIRDLLAGVEHLRVVAATIESMERIEEVRPKRERDK